MNADTFDSSSTTTRGRPCRVLLLVLVVAWFPAAGVSSAQGPLRTSDHADGEVLGYPVPLLRGTLSGTARAPVEVVNESSSRPTSRTTGVADGQRFLALTELVPGENRIRIRSGRDEISLRLRYQPRTSPYRVRVFHFTDSTGSTAYATPLAKDPQDAVSRLDTLAKLMQTFTAERLRALGLGPRTFDLELDGEGRVKVHTVRGKHSRSHYAGLTDAKLRQQISEELAPHRDPQRSSSDLVILAFTRADKGQLSPPDESHSAQGDTVVLGSWWLHAVPASLGQVLPAFADTRVLAGDPSFADPRGKHPVWAIAGQLPGRALHMLGHTFGLPDTTNERDVMARGFELFHRAFMLVEPARPGQAPATTLAETDVPGFSPACAAALVQTRFFASEARPPGSPPSTVVRLDPAKRDLVVRSRNLVGFVGFRLRSGRFEHLPLDTPPASRKEVRIPLAVVGRRFPAPESLVVVDCDGNLSTHDEKELLRGPMVRRWSFSPKAIQWKRTDAFPDVAGAPLKKLAVAASTAAPVVSRTEFIDFAARYPHSPPLTNVAGYAFLRFGADRERTVRMLTGSDDALRIWVNGKLVTSVLTLRPARIDSERTPVPVRAGQNTVFVEVSQGEALWGLYLRFEELDGTPLEIEGDELVRARGVDVSRRLLHGPFIRRWQLAPQRLPWKSTSAFVQVSSDKRQEIEAEATLAPLCRSNDVGPYVDLAQLLADGPRTNVAAYALRTLVSDRPRRVRILAGSDDSIRMWLGGSLILDRLVQRGATPDTEVAQTALAKGSTNLLVEVSQAEFSWGLYARLEDEDGTDLFLEDDGRLVRADELLRPVAR